MGPYRFNHKRNPTGRRSWRVASCGQKDPTHEHMLDERMKTEPLLVKTIKKSHQHKTLIYIAYVGVDL